MLLPSFPPECGTWAEISEVVSCSPSTFLARLRIEIRILLHHGAPVALRSGNPPLVVLRNVHGNRKVFFTFFAAIFIGRHAVILPDDKMRAASPFRNKM